MKLSKALNFLVCSVFGATLFYSSFAFAKACNGKKNPDLSLTLVMDVSASMDHEELIVQMKGYAQSLQDQQVVTNLLECQCTEVSVVLWSGTQNIVFPYTKMESENNIKELAGLFEHYANQPSEAYMYLGATTELYEALKFSREKLDESAQGNMKRVILMSGDGIDGRLGANLENLRLLKQNNEYHGVTVIGVPIDIPRGFADSAHTESLGGMTSPSQSVDANPFDTDYPEISDFYEKEVITSDGFNKKAENYKDVERAMTEALTQITCQPLA